MPLFGVLLADWLRAGARYTRSAIFDAPAWRPELLLAWILGFALYHWLHEPPLGPSWWVDVVEETGQPNLGIGACSPASRHRSCSPSGSAPRLAVAPTRFQVVRIGPQ